MINITFVIPRLFQAKSNNYWQQELKDWKVAVEQKNYSQIIAEFCPFHSISQAEISAAYCHLPIHNNWLKASPISLVSDQHGSYAYSSSTLRLTASESQQLTNDLNPIFAQDGLTFHACDGELLVESSSDLGITTHPLYEIAHDNIAVHLPNGPNKTFWHKIFTEIQLFLHQHPINQRRLQNSQAVINGLWFWGANEISNANASNNFQKIYSDNSWLKHYALYSSLIFESLPADIKINELVMPTHHSLFIIEHFLWEQSTNFPLFAEQLLAWCKRLNNLSYQITLYPFNGNCYYLNQRDPWRQWLKQFLSV